MPAPEVGGQLQGGESSVRRDQVGASESAEARRVRQRAERSSRIPRREVVRSESEGEEGDGCAPSSVQQAAEVEAPAGRSGGWAGVVASADRAWAQRRSLLRRLRLLPLGLARSRAVPLLRSRTATLAH